MCACMCVFVCVCRGEWKGLGCGANGVLLIVALGTGQKHGCVIELRRLVHISLRFKCQSQVRDCPYGPWEHVSDATNTAACQREIMVGMRLIFCVLCCKKHALCGKCKEN